MGSATRRVKGRNKNRAKWDPCRGMAMQRRKGAKTALFFKGLHGKENQTNLIPAEAERGSRQILSLKITGVG
jgi:hypothetical protein